MLFRTPNYQKENQLAKTAKKAATKKLARKPYTPADIKLLKQHSKSKTPVAKIAKMMKRTEGSLRQKALALGIGLGHQR
ncbi:hypothetical protein ACVIJ6_007178 [Bradyrhizobium sp. USDA 4369]|jgi:hypothetical protein